MNLTRIPHHLHVANRKVHTLLTSFRLLRSGRKRVWSDRIADKHWLEVCREWLQLGEVNLIGRTLHIIAKIKFFFGSISRSPHYHGTVKQLILGVLLMRVKRRRECWKELSTRPCILICAIWIFDRSRGPQVRGDVVDISNWSDVVEWFLVVSRVSQPQSQLLA